MMFIICLLYYLVCIYSFEIYYYKNSIEYCSVLMLPNAIFNNKKIRNETAKIQELF